MKIFSAAQIRECDAHTISSEGISSIELMERAAARSVAWLQTNMAKDSLFVVLCGTGNNGGDGLAITRLLHNAGWAVKAFLLQLEGDRTPDCETNLQRLQATGKDLAGYVAPGTFITDIPRNIIIIDAIFGTGVNRPLSGWVEDFVSRVNDLPNRKIAIDMPSGLNADNVPVSGETVLEAHDTLSFQFYKRSFLHKEANRFTGNVHVLDIGLSSEFVHATSTHYYATSRADVVGLYKPRNQFSNKGTYGKLLLAGGSYGKMGAMVLAARAALRAGAGLVTAHVPECGYEVLQTAVPEAMCVTSGAQVLNAFNAPDEYTTAGVGPGMGTDSVTAKALATFIEIARSPIVLDADALNILAAQPELMDHLPKGSVLTPHPKEFARLFGDNTNSMVQADNARMQAMRYNINIVLKGRHTAVINADGECRYNMTGNAGMATGGAGDVLTGIIVALIAQGYEPYNAAVLGVYLHGAAGDAAAIASSQESMTAGDIVEHLGAAFKTVQQ